jgi:tetratricopeptide (TPR) repeat protein
MLEKPIVQKSSEILESNISVEIESIAPARIYTDSSQAIAEFDAEVGPDLERETIIPVDPRISAFQVNAQILMKHKEYGLALNLLRQASNRDSKNPKTLKLLAQCLSLHGQHQEAIYALKALASVDYSFGSIFAYATGLYKLGQDQAALDKYFEALAVLTEENEQLFEAYKNMGNILVRQGDFDGAEEYYNKAYTMNAHSDILLVNFGTLEVQRQDYDKSLYCFRKAVEVNPENDKAWVGLAMVHNHFGDNELAWANIEMALDINPKNRTAVHLIANWGLRDAQVQRAIDSLQIYLGEVEHDEDMSLVLINLFCTTGQFNSARLEIERVLLWNPENHEVRELKNKLAVN